MSNTFSLSGKSFFYSRTRGVCIIFGILLGLYLLHTHFSISPRSYVPSYLHSAPAPSKPAHLRLVLPASEATTNLCKTVLSAAALGYPTPVLVNWNKTYNNPDLIFGGSHIAKIKGTLDYLRKLGTLYQDDLVVVIDGYDSWFQLRPELLIERYYQINKEADERIAKHLGSGAARENVSQRVVFSAQKRCWPKGKNHPACYAVPESTLPPEIYGKDTDKDIGDKKNPFIKYRQRYLNSGLAMGPVKDVRAIFEQAYVKVNRDVNFGSDQSIFAEMFGYQEFQRHVIAYRNRSTVKIFLDWILKLIGRYESVLDKDSAGSRHLMDPAEGHPYEFGIGLDYEMKLSHPTVFCEFDTAWVRYNDTRRLSKLSSEKNISPQRATDLPVDIAYSTPPFFSLRGNFPSGRLPIEESWNNVPLFTNLWTGSVPVAVHHNAHMDGLKSRIQTHWNKTWFQPHSRALLDSRVIEPSHSLGQSKINGETKEWWSPKADVGGVETDKGQIISFESLCKKSWDDIFDDGRGDWRDPRGLTFKNSIPNAESQEVKAN